MENDPLAAAMPMGQATLAIIYVSVNSTVFLAFRLTSLLLLAAARQLCVGYELLILVNGN